MTTGGHPPPISAEVFVNVQRRGLSAEMIMKIQAGGPAFPYVLVNNSSETMNTFGIELAPGKTANFSGMTMRDYFAAKAMQGRLANPDWLCSDDRTATEAYQIADAMLRARGAS